MALRSDAELHQLGRRIAAFASPLPGQQVVSILSLQGCIADLTADDTTLGPPLKDLVSRSSFLALIPLAGSGSGQLQRDALIDEFRAVYSSAVLDAITAVLNGFLALGAPAIADRPQAEEQPSASASASASAGARSGMTSFHVDQPGRLLVLSLLSGGLYAYLWFFRHWRHYRQRARNGLPGKPKDARIIPFWSAVFDGFYIVGTARRIQEKLIDSKHKAAQTRPWLTFILYNLTACTWWFESTEDVATNLLILSLQAGTLTIACQQLARLQRKANLAMQLQGEINNAARHVNKWDIGVFLTGATVVMITAATMLIPASWLQ